MMRHAIRGLVLLALLTLVVDSTVRAQNTPDSVEVRVRKDGSTKTYSGQLKVTAAGYSVFTGEKFDKAGEVFSPDDILKVNIGDLVGVDRNTILSAKTKEEKKTAKDYADAGLIYQDLWKKGATAPDRSRRYLAFKINHIKTRLLDEQEGEEWKKNADIAISDWKGFLNDYKTAFGWEMWPAVRACTRLQVERGKYDEAALIWQRMTKAPELPPDLKLEAAIQEVDAQIRSKAYSNASVATAELLKTAAGPKKERLVIYDLAAKAGSDGKLLEGVDKIKAEMDKSKDSSVHATGYAMMGELLVAADKPRDAMWMFLWVETVVNQDKDEVFKAVSRLTEIFEKLMDEDQTKKYREKIKRFRSTL